MNVAQALSRRRTIRAFKRNRIDRSLLVKILEPALHAPSWANTQPWENFVASGEPLERLRTGYAEKLKGCVPRNPDISMPKDCPYACLTRMEMLKAVRTELLEQACMTGGSSRPDLRQV